MFSECISVAGSNRAIIYDLSRNEFKFIPLELFNILMEDGVSLEEIIRKHKKNEESTLKEYFKFLDKNDYIFFCDKDELDLFPKISLQWDYEAIISNIFIEEILNYPLSNLFDIIKETNCKDIVLKLDCYTQQEVFIRFLNELDDTKVKCVDVFINQKVNPAIQNYIINVINNFPRMRSVIFYNSHQDEIVKGGRGFGNIIYRTDSIENNKSFIDKSYFNVNIKLFTESQLHNTYFNRKLYIGVNGEIKNAPECEESFGNINDMNNLQNFKKIVQSKEFQKYWFVHKELIDVCKDCEFRHMCVDNKIPNQRNTDEWYHKTECSYNPYICKWKSEEGYRTLSECGVISNEHGFSIDHECIAEINKKLWE